MLTQQISWADCWGGEEIVGLGEDVAGRHVSVIPIGANHN